jgi:hypothetical protein
MNEEMKKFERTNAGPLIPGTKTLMLALFFVLAGAVWGQTPTNTNECVWWAPCSTAHCHARVQTDQGVIIKDFGVVGTYQAVFPQDSAHAQDCTSDADRFYSAWIGNHGTACNAFAQTRGATLVLYQQLGTGNWADSGHATSAEIVGYPQSCFGLPTAVHPNYYILGVVYAPPGCTSSGSFKCSAGSSVAYSSSSTTGTTSTIQSSFKAGVDVKVSTGTGAVSDVIPFSASLSEGYSVTSTNGSSETISGTTTSGLNVPGNGPDGVNHDFDFFDLLLNPGVISTSWLYPTAGQPGSVSWELGYTGQAPVHSLVQVSYLRCALVTAGRIKDAAPPYDCGSNPSLNMPANMRHLLSDVRPKGAGLSLDDYQTILLQDPFWNTQSQPVDFASICSGPPSPASIAICGRFVQENFTFSYQQPGGNGCVTQTQIVKNELTKGLSNSYQQAYTVGLSATEGLGATATETGTLTWTNTIGTSNTTTNSQTATAVVGCSSPTYAQSGGPSVVDAYFDALYGTFLLNPKSTLGMKTISHGLALAPSGPAPGVPVQLTYAGTTYHTFTDNLGNFAFYPPEVSPSGPPPTTAVLSVAGSSKTVIVGAPETTVVVIPQPAPVLSVSLQSRSSGAANLSMRVADLPGITTATNVTVTAITGITATGATFVYNPGSLAIPFAIPGGSSLKPGSTAGFNLNFGAISGNAAAPFSFVITIKADNLPAFSTTINVPAPSSPVTSIL